MEKRLLSYREASDYSGIPIYTLRELTWRGDLLVIKLGRGGKYWLDRTDLDELIQSRKGRV